MTQEINNDHLHAILGGNVAPEDVDAELRSVLGHEAVENLSTVTDDDVDTRPTDADLTRQEEAHLETLRTQRASDLAQQGVVEVAVTESNGDVRMAHATIVEPGATSEPAESAQPEAESFEADVPDWVNGRH